MMLKSAIEEVVHIQREEMERFNTGIERELLEKIRLDTGFVVIITGVRRCGKSTLLRQMIRNRLYGKVHWLNFEDHRLTGFESRDFIKLEEIFSAEEPDAFFFFDEIQNIEGWESYIRHKQDNGDRIVLTGSNARLLSKELGTKLTGRHLDYELFPFSYPEYLSFTKQTPGEHSFAGYMNRGGFPEYLKYDEPEILYRITDDILYRDIMAKYGIRNHKVLKELLIWLMTNSGKRYSNNSLKKIFSLGSANTVSDYISFFENSYLLFTVPKFSFSTKEQMINPRKIYVIDTGLAGVNSLSLSKDSGRKLESLVYLALRKKYKQIYYYGGKGECDFLIRENEKFTRALQVCLELTPDNLDRELNGLYEAMETVNLTEGWIITMSQQDHFEQGNRTVHAIPAWQWLLNNDEGRSLIVEQ